MSLGPGKMNLMLTEWEKKAETAPSFEKVSKATGELQLFLNVCFMAEAIDIFISLQVGKIILHGCTPCWSYPCLFFDLWLRLACCSLPEATLKVLLQMAICAVYDCVVPSSNLLM